MSNMDYIGFKGLAVHTTRRGPIEMQDSSAHLSLVGIKWAGGGCEAQWMI